MPLEQLVQVIERLRERIQRHRALLTQNEALTRYVLVDPLLRALGVTVDPDTGVPAHDPATMETDVPGVFVAGVVAGGNEPNRIFIENGREHGPRIVRAVAARLEARGAVGDPPAR